jgi:hypothetical protein
MMEIGVHEDGQAGILNRDVKVGEVGEGLFFPAQQTFPVLPIVGFPMGLLPVKWRRA